MTDKPSVREAAERTAAVSFTEISSKRRGPIRRYFHTHPVAMDWVLIGIHLLFGLPNAVMTAADGEWSPLLLLLAGGAALVWRRRYPLLVLAAIAVVDMLIVLLTSTGSGSFAMWFAVYTVATTQPAVRAIAAAVLAVVPMIVVMAVRDAAGDRQANRQRGGPGICWPDHRAGADPGEHHRRGHRGHRTPGPASRCRVAALGGGQHQAGVGERTHPHRAGDA